MFSALLDAGHQVSVVVRRGYDQLLPFLDNRLRPLITDVNPYALPNESTWEKVESLRESIQEHEPQVLVSALYNRTWVDEWIMGKFPKVDRVGFDNPSLSRSILDSLQSSYPAHRFPAGPLFDELVTCAEDSHESVKNKALIKTLLGNELTEFRPVLTIPSVLKVRVSSLLDEMGLQPGDYVLGVPAGNANVTAKVWPTSDFTDLMEHLHKEYGLSVLLTGVKKESDILDEVARNLAVSGGRALTWVGSDDDLDILIGLVDRSRLYVGVDTGTMHFAAALDKPVVALFGGGTWPRFLPLAGRSFVATQKLPCFGCNWACWLNEPKCMTLTCSATFISGLDWILNTTVNSDSDKIDLGRKLDPLLEQTIHSAVTAVDRANRRWEESERDRAARLAVIERQGREYGEVEAERNRLRCELEEMQGHYEESERDRAARLEVINSLGKQLEESEADRAARLRWIQEMRSSWLYRLGRLFRLWNNSLIMSP